MSIQCSLSPSCLLSPSTAANPLVTCKQFACVCMYILTDIHKYSCTRVTLQRVAISSVPLSSQVRCFCTKSLSQVLIISCITYSDALRFACELWAMIAIRRTEESSQAKVHRGHPLEEAIGPVCHLHPPPRGRSWAAVAPVSNSF